MDTLSATIESLTKRMRPRWAWPVSDRVSRGASWHTHIRFARRRVTLVTMNANLIDSITSIATLLTAAAALFTILEMRRQRSEGYRPVIAIDDELVSLYRSLQDRRPAIVFQRSGGFRATESSVSDVRFRVQNVGAGPALGVQARWEFDAIDFAAVVTKCDPAMGQTLSVESDFIRSEPNDGSSWMARRIQEHHL